MILLMNESLRNLCLIWEGAFDLGSYLNLVFLFIL